MGGACSDRQRHGKRVDVEQVPCFEQDVRAAAQSGARQRAVDRPDGQRGWDRQPIQGQRAVGDDEQPNAPRTNRGQRFRPQSLERTLEPGGSITAIPGGIQATDAGPPLPIPAAVSERAQEAFEIGDKRPLQADRGGAADRALRLTPSRPPPHREW